MSQHTPHDALRRKLSFAIPAVVFLSLAALEPIELGFFAETLASLETPLEDNVTPVTNMPATCIDPLNSDSIRHPQQIDI